jgi:hypothetical protein
MEGARAGDRKFKRFISKIWNLTSSTNTPQKVGLEGGWRVLQLICGIGKSEGPPQVQRSAEAGEGFQGRGLVHRPGHLTEPVTSRRKPSGDDGQMIHSGGPELGHVGGLVAGEPKTGIRNSQV